MTKPESPIEFDLGHFRLPDGDLARCTAIVTISLAIDGVRRGDEGLILEDYLTPSAARRRGTTR